MAWEKIRGGADPARMQAGNRAAVPAAGRVAAFAVRAQQDHFLDAQALHGRRAVAYLRERVRGINAVTDHGHTTVTHGELGAQFLAKKRETLEASLPRELSGQVSEAIFRFKIPKAEALRKAREALKNALGESRKELIEDVLARLARDPRLDRMESRRAGAEISNLDFFGARVARIASDFKEQLSVLDQAEQNWAASTQSAGFLNFNPSFEISLPTLAWNSFILGVLDMMAKLSWESFQHQREQTARLIEEAREIRNAETRKAVIRAIMMAGEIMRVFLATEQSNRVERARYANAQTQPA